jgi:hypothetical protein
MRNPSFRVAVIGWLTVAALATVACSASGKTTSTAGTSSTTGASALAASKLKALATLDQSKLCGLLQSGEPDKIMGSKTAPAHYLNTLGLGIVCMWTTPFGGDGLYIGISTALDFAGAKAAGEPLHATTGTIDGRDALFVPRGSFDDYYTVQVALGGPNDVVVEYRAPTAAAAATLAKTVTPRLVALSGSA